MHGQLQRLPKLKLVVLQHLIIHGRRSGLDSHKEGKDIDPCCDAMSAASLHASPMTLMLFTALLVSILIALMPTRVVNQEWVITGDKALE